MRKLFLLILLGSSLIARAQTTPVAPIQLTTNSAYIEPSTGLHWFYNGTTYQWWADLGVRDSSKYITPYYAAHNFAPIGSGVTNFNGRTGNVTFQSSDGSPYFPLLNGTGATGTWGINISGNATTVTNGVYTTTFNGLGDARYPLLSGSYANPSWITSFAYNKLTGAPNSITALTGDGTASGPGSVTFTLSTVNANTGSYGTVSSVPTITFDGKGRATSVANTSIQIAESQVTNLVADLASKANLTGGNSFTGNQVFANNINITPFTNSGIVVNNTSGLLSSTTLLTDSFQWTGSNLFSTLLVKGTSTGYVYLHSQTTGTSSFTQDLQPLAGTIALLSNIPTSLPTPYSLTLGNGLLGGSFNGSAPITASLDTSYVATYYIRNNATNTPQSARISLSDSIKTTGVVQSSMINTDSTKYNMPWMGGGVILPGISEIKQSIIVPGRLGFYASAIGTTLSEKASLRNGGGMLAINGRYNDGPAFMVADSDYVSHALSTYYFAGSKGKGFLGFLHQNSTYTLTITPSNGIRTALQYDSIGNVGIMQRTGVFTVFGKAAYNEAQPLTALSFLYKGKTDSLYAPISGSVKYIQNNATNTPQSARISVSDSIKTSGVVKSGAILSVTTNTNSIDVSSNSFVWDNPSILTQFANSQASYTGIYNSFVTYGYNQFGSGNATLKVVPSQYVLQSFARDTAFSNRYQGTITFGTGVQTALGINIGSPGAPVLFNGAGGTPLSITLTNASGTASSLTAGLATALQTARAINGVNFDGTAPITITAAPTAGSTSYIQNGPSQQTSANYNIDGNGTIGGNLRVTGLAGMGAASSAGIRLLVSGTAPNSGTASTGILINHTIPSSSTGSVAAYQSNLVTQAASFTLATFRHFYAIDVTIGSGSTVTNQYGFYVAPLTGGTNNYGFYSDLSASANRWNFYANGTAVNYFNGNLQLGSTTATAGAPKLDVTGNIGSTSLTANSLLGADGNKIISTITALPNGTTATTGTAGTGGTNVATQAYADAGFPKTVANPRVTAQTTLTSVGNIWTVGASDGSFTISANVLVTASTVHSFGATCTYTDESNTSRTLTLNFSQLTGAFITAITNGTGASAYEGVPVHIRAKAGTSISVATAGTFTSVTYNAEWILQQVN